MTVDGSQQFQTIDGFGTNLSSEAWNGGAVTPSLDTLLSHGYRLYRVIVEPVQGWEDTNPNTGSYSDSNPNWPYYNNLYGTSTKFTNLWNTVSYLNQHGATVWVNLQSDAPAWMTDNGGAPATIGPDHEADWATMVSTMVDYAVNTAHVHIDALGPMNEPDVADYVQGPQVGPTQYVRMLDTLETQLQGYGLGNIPLVGPDTGSPAIGVDSYVPAMLADPNLMPHVLQFGFHTYGSTVSDPAITNNATYPGRHILSDEYDGPYYNEDHGQRATPAQLWAQADASFQNLVSMVNAGENGATIWDGVDNFYEYYQQWSAHGLISYDWTAPDPTAQADYGTTQRLYANAQMFQFVNAGDIVIGVSDDANNFIEVAFKDPATGHIAIVGENTGTSSLSFTGNLAGGLNASVFNLYYTNSSLQEQQQADVVVTNNTFQFSVPADTIFTLTTPMAPAVAGVTPISGLTGGGQTVTITGSDFIGTTSVFFGGVTASSFAINSDSQITAVTPAHAAGTVDVTVASPNGASALTAADQFQYVAPNGTAPPTVAMAASATLAGNQASAALSVLGASQYGESTLTYTWATIGTPSAPVSFSANGNNSASNVSATFIQAGSYTFGVTITDPAGNITTSSTMVTVAQVATTLTVSPESGTVLPNGALQFTATATDQFGNPYGSALSWTVNGGGTIDGTGKFTAGSATGGPFTVTTSAGALNAAATVTISNNVNLALNGTAYRWFGMANATDTTNQTAAPGLNDNNLSNSVPLAGGGDDVANAYEAAGVVWSTAQSVNQVAFTNGSFNSSTYDGVFDSNFGLETTSDGVTWSNVSGWALSPAYPYNLPAAAGVTYTFTGPALSVRGVRVVGQVHSLSGNDSWYDNASEVAVTQTVSQNATSTALTSSDATPVYGETVAFTATVTANPPGSGIPTGSVTFMDGGSTLGSASVDSSGTARFMTMLGLGAHSVTASYGGDTNFTTSTSGAQSEMVGQDSTATAVSADSNPAVFGQPVTLTATVSAAPPGSGTATGTVTFRDGTTVLGTSTVDAMGHAALAALTFSVGSHSITASYGGNTNFTASTSATFTETINPAGTTTSLTWENGSASPSVYGQPVTFNATVTASPPSTATPTGSVTFYRDGTAIATISFSGGQASFTTAYSTPGTHSFFAQMVATANFQTSQSATLSQTVNAAPTTTALTWASGSSSPSVYGQPVTFSVTVAATSPSVATPSGSVTFYRDGAPIGTTTLSGGRATLSTTYTAVGSHSFSASYAGNTSFQASADNTGVTQAVNAAPTTTMLTWASGSGSPSVYGQLITFVATVTANSPSVATPSGSVTFYRDGTAIGTVNLSGGNASISTTYTVVGMHTFSASFLGNTSFQASASSMLSQTVNKAPTSTSLTAGPGSPNPSTVGQAVTFVATETANSPSVATVTGSVRFYSDGTTVLGTVTLSSGTASLTTSALPAGSHTITAIYLGNSGFITSTSNSDTQVVNPSGAGPVAASVLQPNTGANPVLVVRTPDPGIRGALFYGDAAIWSPIVASIGSTSRSLALSAAVSELDALAGLDVTRLDKFFQALGLD
jgi:hypothetical protein